MKVLWLCNTVFSTSPIKTTGSWLQPLAEMLLESDVKIATVAESLNSPSIQTENVNGIQQYLIPKHKHKKHNHIPNRKTTLATIQVIKDFNPDIIHVWGTEYIWGYMNYMGVFDGYKVLLDIQGLLSAYTKYYYGGLNNKEILKCIHLKEILLPWRLLYVKKNTFKKGGEIEKAVIRSFRHISYQSEWVKHHLLIINPDAQLHPTKILLRKSFYNSQKWSYHDDGHSPIVFSMCSGAIPYKGIHILLKAIAILTGKYSDIEVRIAGNMHIGNRIIDGYSVYLDSLIKSLGIESNVTLLGAIDENEIITELNHADVCVVPSFVETYCLAFAEAMIVGTPTVASYTSALPYLATQEKECLFYNSQDTVECSKCIMELIENRSLAMEISRNAINRRLAENDPQTVIDNQLYIYQSILNE